MRRLLVGVFFLFAQHATAQTPADEALMRWEHGINTTRTEMVLCRTSPQTKPFMTGLRHRRTQVSSPAHSGASEMSRRLPQCAGESHGNRSSFTSARRIRRDHRANRPCRQGMQGNLSDALAFDRRAASRTLPAGWSFSATIRRSSSPLPTRRRKLSSIWGLHVSVQQIARHKNV